MVVTEIMKKAELCKSFKASLGFDMIQLEDGSIILELPVTI